MKNNNVKNIIKAFNSKPKEIIDDKPIILYHGTSLSNLESIKKEGLKPRGKKKSNFSNIGISRPDLVYLTNCYACYYAFTSLKNAEDKGVILKVKIDPKKIKLYLDEEFIYHLLKYNETGSKTALKKYKSIDPKNLDSSLNKLNWKDGLNFMGTVSCDYIPVDNIIGYSVLDELGIYQCDPSISPLNYKICSGMYIDYLKKLKYKKL